MDGNISEEVIDVHPLFHIVMLRKENENNFNKYNYVNEMYIDDWKEIPEHVYSFYKDHLDNYP